MISRPPKTAADYMAIAVCPALIMVLVGSLVFYLIQIGYSGEWIGRLQWTLFWFVFAMVLVSRIAIEQSPSAAFGYGLALAGATSIMLSRYLGFLWGVWLLLALIWWACNKIVWDCTFIDEDQDASGQGLLQISRFEQWTRGKLTQIRAVPSEDVLSSSLQTRDEDKAAPLSLSQPAIPVPRQSSIRGLPGKAARPGRPSQPRKKPPKKQDLHAPGLWVLYFSVAAVPVFGLGELLLKSDDLAGRRFCFLLLFAYLAAGTGLLLLTSFLGLRRYLRQRYLVMPATIARSWVINGAGLLIAVLCLALILPRPATPYSLAALFPKLGSPKQQASEYAPPGHQGAPGQSRQKAGSPEDQGAQKETPSENNQGSKALGQPAGAKSSSGQASSAVGPPTPSLSFQLQKWLSYLAAAVVLAMLVYRFAPQLRQWLFSSKKQAKKPARKEHPRRAQEEQRSARRLPNPFSSGQAERMPPDELVRYSFEALRIWAAARGFEPKSSETPLEFAERLALREPALKHEIFRTTSYFSHVTFGHQMPPEEYLPVLKSLWSVIGFS